MNINIRKTMIILIAPFSFCMAAFQSSDAVSLANTKTHLLYSDSLKQHYLIDVFLPKNYQPKKSEYQFPKYPVIYVLNSRPNAVMTATLRHVAELNQEIVVGIDFADENAKSIDSFSKYTRDLTPTADNDWSMVSTAGAGGKAEYFIDFINTVVKPFINKSYTINTYNQSLVGHSFGGLFGLYVLMNHPNSFDRFVIASPSLWWDNEVMMKFERLYAKKYTDLDKQLYISVASEEMKSGEQDIINSTQRFVDQLKRRNYANLKMKFQLFEGENHLSTLGLAIHKGLQFVFR